MYFHICDGKIGLLILVLLGLINLTISLKCWACKVSKYVSIYHMNNPDTNSNGYFVSKKCFKRGFKASRYKNRCFK